MVEPRLIRHLPASADEDTVLTAFMEYVDEIGLELYPAQEEAIFEFLLGNHVIVNTPTGSGK